VPTVSLPPGSRTARMFFDEYPRFYETSRTGPLNDRINLRYEAIFAEHRHLFEDARVLDISSHDGRWSLAALETGARSVVGIEARPETVADAEASMAHYGIDRERYAFTAGDAFEVLAEQTFDVDVVMCLGFYYHTLRYSELLYLMTRLKPRHIILDTEVSKFRRGSVVQIRGERADVKKNAVADRYSVGNMVLSGKPNIRALRLQMGLYGYEIATFSNWPELIRDNPGMSHIADYEKGTRVTAVCRPGVIRA
jgi:hypothetical protein